MSLPYAEVIGDPIEQSKSPVIHGFWLGLLGIAAEYRRCHVTAAGCPPIWPNAGPMAPGAAATSLCRTSRRSCRCSIGLTPKPRGSAR